MVGSIIAKIFAEGLVTLYTVVVRTSSFSPLTQSAFRSAIIPLVLFPFLLYFGVSGVSNWWSYIFSLPWIGIGIVNLLHIVSSFEGFKILPTGPAVTLYFTYPLMTIILSVLLLGRGITYNSIIGITVAFIGTVVLQSNHINNGDQIYNQNNKLTMNLPGIGWILLSAFTEAILYLFVISGGSVYNNHFFTVSALYFWAGVISLLYLLYIYLPTGFIRGIGKDREEPGGNKTQADPPLVSYDTLYLLLANLVLGVGGKVLLYSSARGLSTGSYAALSYTGIVFAYLYGLFMGDGIKMNDIISSLLITFGSIYGGVL